VGTEYLAGDVVGYATYSYTVYTGIDRITEGAIVFDTEETWAPYGIGGTDFYAVALHEIGHIIGLGHVDDITEIMNPYISADDLGDGDIDGARYLYGEGDGSVAADAPEDDGGGGGGGGLGGIVALIGGILAAILGFGAIGGPTALALGRVEDNDMGEGADGEPGDPPAETDLLAMFDNGETYDELLPTGADDFGELEEEDPAVL